VKSSLISRLKWLESRTQLREPFKLIYGWLTHLPEDYIGERHPVIVNREPAGSPHAGWCHFEERPGPAPPGWEDGCLVITIPAADASGLVGRVEDSSCRHSDEKSRRG
jgi:hypothetical protein